jgi:hypothetical protein
MKSLKLAGSALIAVSLSFAPACGESDGGDDSMLSTSGGLDGTTTPGTDAGSGGDMTGDTAADDTTSADGTDSSTSTGSTSTSGSGDCADYRTVYPGGPYGTAVGTVLMEMPGMVMPDGTMTGLEDVYADKSKVALLLVNAFDT